MTNQNPNQPVVDPAQQKSQGGGMSQGGPSAQTANTQGDVKQMRVDDVINLANQQNLDVSALNELLGKIQVNPEVSTNVGTGDQGGATSSGQANQ